jgi:hypothetical protein
MKIIILSLFIFATQTLPAQDTLKILQYNLLNYGNYTSYCTTSNNNINDKDEYIRTIIEYAKPDIFTVNEISSSDSIHQRLLDNDLNVNGINYYRKANFIKIADSYLVNMLYYNWQKLELHSHTIAQSYIRDIDVYKLYYRSDDLVIGDTTFVICIVAHLKSSGGANNENKRRDMVYNAMNYLNDYDDSNNYLFMGDFNVYSSSEPAYQLLTNYTNPELNFYDPIDTPGDWNNNYTFRFVHTQSTHDTQNGCASYSGMDDRFDFILLSDNIMQGFMDVEYIEGSYTTIGQDGLHFDNAINSNPENISAPSNVIEALCGNSEHLPISIMLKVNKTLGIINHEYSLFSEITFKNPVSETLGLSIQAKTNSNVNIKLMDIRGKCVFSDEVKVSAGQNHFNYNLSKLTAGIYFGIFTDGNNNSIVKKIVKR